MKRSEVNAIIRETEIFIRQHHFRLPPFAFWTPDEWQNKGEEVSEIVDCMLGWDITDFGLGRYEELGLAIFTIRNGRPENLESMKGKIYAEKLLVVGVDQITPFHFHWTKVEDIINRGGGKLAIQLYNSTEEGGLADSEIKVSMDGVSYTFPAGHIVYLEPGESITLPTNLYHQFWGVDEKVMVGEVSMVNDDNSDNRFLDPVGRFPDIDEDEPPLYLLVGDYPAYYGADG